MAPRVFNFYTKIRRTASREDITGVVIESPSEISFTSQEYGAEGFKGCPQWGPIMPRCVLPMKNITDWSQGGRLIRKEER